MKKKLIKILGLSLFILTLVANIHYALVDYGLNENTLGGQLIAQTNSGGGGSGSGSGSGTGWWDSKVYSCVEYTCSITVGFPPYTMTYNGTYDKCEDGSDVAHCWNCDSCNAGPV